MWFMKQWVSGLFLRNKSGQSVKMNTSEQVKNLSKINPSGFGGLEVAFWLLVPKFVGSHPAEAVRFLGRKNPQNAFLRRGSKAVGPMS
jgi:hypothetical protein